MFRKNQVIWWPCAVLALAAHSATAAPVAATTTLKQTFEAAWQRQPEALSQQMRLDAAAAQQQAATRWTAEPVAPTASSST